MNDDLISREALKNAKPEFLNEKVVSDTKYQTTKLRIYAKAWNACNSCWIDLIDNAPAVRNEYMRGYEAAEREYKRPQGMWKHIVEEDNDVECPFCGFQEDGIYYNFCPGCGAKMQIGGEKNDK